jgi:hypothetical protein
MRARRNPRWIAAGVLAVCLGAVGSLLLHTQASSSTTVITVTRTVMRGETLQPTDLGQATVGNMSGLDVVPAGRLPELVGRQALFDLAEGSIVMDGTIGTLDRPAGQAQVGLKLSPGRMPSAPLPHGTVVRLIPVTADEQPATGQGAVRGTIANAPSPTPDGAHVLDVLVPAKDAERIARLAALDQIAIIMDAPA